MNITRCLIYRDDPLVTQVLMRHHRTSREKQTNRVVWVGLFSPKTAPNFLVMDRTSFFGAHGCLEELPLYAIEI